MSALLNSNNKLKLGIFSANCSSGQAMTKIEERWDSSWDNNLKQAQLTDEAGLEFQLPIARWIGYGGDTNFQHNVLETLTWAAGLLAQTKNITIFATTHTGFHNPVIAAKQLATLDQIGHGRAGVNIVCGWNRPEYEALGFKLPDDHETRYCLGQEWYDIVKKCWSETDGDFDWDGEFYQLKGVHSYPKPVNGTIPVFNAGGSKEGKAFATRNANYLFTPVIEHEKSRADIRELKQQAGALDREVGVFALTYVVCRPTQKEADEFHDYYARDNADWTAVDRVIELMFANAESFPKDVIKMLRERMAGGHGGMPLMGTPDKVVEELERLHEIGCAGATLSFVDFAGEFPYFRDEVLPRLEEKGLRESYV